MGGRAWFKYEGSLQILAIFQGFGGDDFMMSEVTFEMNLSFKNSHIGGLHKKNQGFSWRSFYEV